ncbi:ZIP family metal transporter [Parvularcula sp. IMCC14364]|uniref:ZIP family metal transporter n=1 Tax=Parvularcula sp. IMCC14364 TaxID=3067902 RepID=UPI002740DE69|nr:ZIP family metal transporter [Parvularcula sp. IMCC14364]
MIGAIEMETATAALLASSLAALVATTGLLVVVFKADFAERFSPYLASLAAGFLVATAAFLFPEAIAKIDFAPVYVLLGYVMLFGLNNLFDNENSSGRLWLPFIAIGLHSFIDGVEYGVLFGFDIFAALIASSGLILHEFAEAVVLYMLMRRAGLGKWTAFFLAFLGAAVTTPAGTIVANSFLEDLDAAYFGIVTSIAVGALLYVGTTHLTDHIKDASNRKLSMVLYLVGLMVAGALSLTHFHGSEHDDHDHHHHTALERQWQTS